MKDNRPLRVAIDITPTVGQGYGVGRYVVDLLDGLAGQVELFGVYQGHHGSPPEAVIKRCSSIHRYDLIGGRIDALVRLPRMLRSIGADRYCRNLTITAPESWAAQGQNHLTPRYALKTPHEWNVIAYHQARRRHGAN